MKILNNIGKYAVMLSIVYSKPEKWRIFREKLFNEIELIGVKSLPIVALMSAFMGGVGYITRSSTILEFSPTIISLILAGKVGSNIASEIGTMRVTEQIDALEIMGVNSLNYLVLPKVTAAMIFFPILIIFSIGLALVGGWLALTLSGLSSTETYIYGIRSFYLDKEIIYALTKSVVFAFLITSISSFYGYYTKGGALDVGRSSTQSVVSASISILIANFLLTQMILLQ
jgi:phospholipid/cholesterol/gamma-HCH transport system permease protein